jgi:hypothetical protein
MPRTTSQVAALQGPLRAQYKTDPTGANVVDHAATLNENPMDPFHSIVAPAPEHEVTLPVGVHRALGGPHSCIVLQTLRSGVAVDTVAG